MNLDHDLYSKFQRRVDALEKGEKMTFQKNDDLLTKIIDAPLCKKCLRCYEKEGVDVNNMPHHKDVVRQTESTKESLCRYVLFRKWFEFLVCNRHLIGQSQEYKESLQSIMLTFHNEQVVCPNLEWYYWQLFQEHLPGFEEKPKKVTRANKNSTSSGQTENGEGFERYKKYLKEEQRHEQTPSLSSTTNNKNCEEQKEELLSSLSFLIFFITFYIEEYGYLADRVTVEKLSLDTTFDDLVFDDVGKVNLYTTVHHRYVDILKQTQKFGILTFQKFDKCVTVGDLYELIITKDV